MSMNIIERAISYTMTKNPHGKLFAMVAKDGAHTCIVFYDAATIRKLVSAHSPLFSYQEDGIRWKGLQVNKLGSEHFAAVRFERVKWNTWEANKAGFMSDAQELAVIAALEGTAGKWYKGSNDNRIAYRNWVWTGHNHRRGVTDGHAEDGPDVEVKGVGGRIFHS